MKTKNLIFFMAIVSVSLNSSGQEEDKTAKKIKTMRTFARTAAKSMEKKLVENAKKLKQNPYIILPDYDDNYSKKSFNKIKKDLDKLNRFADDTKKLEKLSNKRVTIFKWF